MEKAIVWDLFDNTDQACASWVSMQIFERSSRQPAIAFVHRRLGKRVNSAMEWSGDWDINSDDMHHRHVSHLYGLTARPPDYTRRHAPVGLPLPRNRSSSAVMTGQAGRWLGRSICGRGSTMVTMLST